VTGEGTYLQIESDRTGVYSSTASCRVLSSHWRVVINTLQWSRHAGLLRRLTWGESTSFHPMAMSTSLMAGAHSMGIVHCRGNRIRELTNSKRSLTPEDGPDSRPSLVPHPADGTQLCPRPLPWLESKKTETGEPWRHGPSISGSTCHSQAPGTDCPCNPSYPVGTPHLH
jgi:hypothetical protein